MSLPEAYIGHRTSKRLRIKIPSRRGDKPFFENLHKELRREGGALLFSVNADTGSVLISGSDLDVQEIAYHGKRKNLFLLSRPKRLEPVVSRVVNPIQGLNDRIGRATGRMLDLPGILAMFFLGFGLFELMRGNLRSPPWYTALWYAFGLLSKSLSDARHGAGEG